MMELRNVDGKGKRQPGMSSTTNSTRPPPSYSIKLTPEKIAKQTRSIVMRLVRKMHDEGRLSTLQQISKFLNEQDFELLRGQHGVTAAKHDIVKQFLLSFPLIFYVGDANVSHRSLFAGLTRDCTHYNTRFAMALSEVYDDDLELPLLWQGDEKPSLQRPESSAPEYPEYLLAKASIAILRVLEVLESSMKNRFLPWPAVESIIPSIKRRLGPLGEALIWYCCTDQDFETGLMVFFYLIEGVFKVDDAAITLNATRLQGIWIATETDLLWGVTSVWLLRGVSTVAEMVEKLRGFARVRKLRYDRVINESTVKAQLKFWHVGLFLPGDGIIHRVSYATPCQDDQLQALKDLFIKVLQESKFGRISYKSCRKILEKRLPCFKDWDVCESSASIAANLCRSGAFNISKGTVVISKNAQTPRVNLNIGNLNIEVPRNVIPLGKRPECLPPIYICGAITEIALRSAVIVCECCGDRCRKKLSSSATLSTGDKIFAFCHISATTFRGNPIEDFTMLFDVGDRLVICYELLATPHVRRPYYITAVDIKCVLSRANDDDDDENVQNTSRKRCSIHKCDAPEFRRNHQPKWEKRHLERKKRRKKTRNVQGSVGCKSGASPNSSASTSADSLSIPEKSKANEDQSVQKNRGASGVVVGDQQGPPELSNIIFDTMTDMQYLPPDGDPNAFTLVHSNMIPECSSGTTEIQFEGEFVGRLSQYFQDKLTLSTPWRQAAAEGSNDDVARDEGNKKTDDDSIKAGIIETIIRSIGWTKVLSLLGCSEQQMPPTGYSPNNNDRWLTNMAWEAISNLGGCFNFSNDLLSLISLLMSPSPMYLIELTPVQEDARTEGKKDDNDDQGPSQAFELD